MEDTNKLSIGKRLKKAREAKGLSLEAVHETIKVPLDSLRAIEEGYTVRTLSPFYYKGFVKIYGQYLGVDVSEVVQQSQQERIQKTEESSSSYFYRLNEWKAVFTKQHLRQAAIVFAALICIFFFARFVNGLWHRLPKKERKVQEAILVEPQEGKKVVVRKPEQQKVMEPVAEVVPERKRRRPIKEEVTPQPKGEAIVEQNVQPKREVKPEVKASERLQNQVVEEPVVAKTPVPAPAAQATQPQAASAKNLKSVVLTVRARKESWLRVKSDDQVVFQSTLKVGSVETWIANEKIEISGKNLNQLEFELNGKMIGALGRKGSQAKTLIVTKDGLNVTQ